jgi:hypothetical protein
VPRPLAAFGLVTLLLAVAPAAPVPQTKKGPPYFPTKVGAKWVYQWSYPEGAHDVTLVVTGVDEKDGAAVVAVGRLEAAGTVAPYEKVAVSEKGLLRVEWDGHPLDPPACRLKLPAEPGVKWEWEHIIPRAKDQGTSTIGKVETIEVPAGKYESVRVETTATHNGRRYTHTIWYAPGVGVVKMVQGDTTQALKSFTQGKD